MAEIVRTGGDDDAKGTQMNRSISAQQGPARELRLALAMRGGVSLAVWIGGTCCEVDNLRKAVGPDPTASELDGSGFWARLLARSGYSSVAVDILAGASAGGLNGVIYAASQQYGFDLAGLKNLWESTGDARRLLRTKQEAANGVWPSLFKGDEYLFEEARKALAELAEAGTAPTKPPPVLLTLSATLVEPVRRAGRGLPDESPTLLRFGSGFKFEQPRHRWQNSDFPHTGQIEPLWSRLAMAARSTSSYPAAFEASLIRSERPRVFGQRMADVGEGLCIDMGGVFTDRGTPDGVSDRFIVSDGGILDNIPLGRALDAIARAAADGPTDRYLIYVHPGAPSGPPAAQRQGLAERRSLFNVVRGLIGARLPAEDISGDLEQLDEYNTRVERAQSLRRSGFQGLTSQNHLLDAAARAWSGYRVLRAEEDERLIAALLDDPIRALGEDPFPSNVGEISEDRWRSPLDAAGASGLIRPQLAGVLTDMFVNRQQVGCPQYEATAADAVATGARPLLRITEVLIEWARYLEGGDPAACVHKSTLYGVAAFIRDAIDRPRRLGWVTLAASATQDVAPHEFAISVAVLDGLLQVPAAEADSICQTLLDPGGDAADALLAAFVEASELAVNDIPNVAGSGQPAGPVDDTVDLRKAILHKVLVPTANALQALAHETPESDQSAGAYLNRVLEGPITCRTLMALEVVTFPEFAAGLPGRRPVRFHRLSAASATPLASEFANLLAKSDGSGGLSVEVKLAGNESANFSAFLRKDWRNNDWMWGRLDAVPTLVDLLLTSENFTRGLSAGDTADSVRDLVAGTGPLREFLLGKVLSGGQLAKVLAELAEPTGDMPVLRECLNSARQWEILAEELLPVGANPATHAAQLSGKVANYDVGAQTITSPETRVEVRDTLTEIVDVAGNVLLYSAQLQFPRVLGTPTNPKRRGRVFRWLGTALGGWVVKGMTTAKATRTNAGAGR
jgi:patatin-related protein